MSEEQIEMLSERELELVRLLSQGLSNKQIAQELYISPNTVKVHLRNIYTKLNVSSRTEATIVAVRMGWVEIAGSQSEPPASQAASIPDQEELVSRSVEKAEENTVVVDVHVPQPPLALWQHVYLIVGALLVALGLLLIWPSRAQHSGPLTDRRPQFSNLNLDRDSRWQSMAQMPTPRSRLAVVEYLGRIYAIAGETQSGVSAVVERYIPSENDWERGTDKPISVANVGAVALNGRILVPGGSLADGQMSDRLEIYDPSSGALGAWSTGASLPYGVCAYAIVAYRGDLYLFGGWDGTSYVSRAYRYSPEKDAWDSLAPMPSPRAFAGAGMIGEHIYVVGGYDGQSELDRCEVYDPAEDTWLACPSMNAPRGGVGVAVIADTLYVIGGGWENYLVENEYFSPDPSDPTRGTWSTFPSPLLQEWRNLGLAVDQTSLYAIGGWDGDFLGTNQAYRALYRLFLPSAMGQGQ